MKGFIEKLIEKVEEYRGIVKLRCGNRGDFDFMEVEAVKEIVNQLAEEYKDKVIIDGQYCFQTCGANEHCKECNRLSNGSIDYYENYNCLAEEYNNGWIPCSERLPEKEMDVLVCFSNDINCVIAYRTKMMNTNLKDVWVNSSTAHIISSNIIAWMPLPAPYQKGE